MQEYICGNRKGYLFPKEEVDTKLKAKYAELKDVHITDLDRKGNAVIISFYDAEQVVKEDNKILIKKSILSILCVATREFIQLLGIKDKSIEIEIMSKIDGNRYEDVLGAGIPDLGGLHYFIVIEHPFRQPEFLTPVTT